MSFRFDKFNNEKYLMNQRAMRQSEPPPPPTKKQVVVEESDSEDIFEYIIENKPSTSKLRKILREHITETEENS